MGQRERDKIRERLESLDTSREFMLRVNAGIGWTGQISEHTGSRIIIKNPRPFHGVPKGVSDLIGLEVVEITPDMVGQRIAVFVAEEVKTTGKLSDEQKSFGALVTRMGGIFRVLR